MAINTKASGEGIALDAAEAIIVADHEQAAVNGAGLLKNIAQMAKTAATITEAGEALGLNPGELDTILKTDPEVADIWNEARTQTVIDIEQAAANANLEAAEQVLG